MVEIVDSNKGPLFSARFHTLMHLSRPQVAKSCLSRGWKWDWKTGPAWHVNSRSHISAFWRWKTWQCEYFRLKWQDQFPNHTPSCRKIGRCRFPDRPRSWSIDVDWTGRREPLLHCQVRKSKFKTDWIRFEKNQQEIFSNFFLFSVFFKKIKKNFQKN